MLEEQHYPPAVDTLWQSSNSIIAGFSREARPPSGAQGLPVFLPLHGHLWGRIVPPLMDLPAAFIPNTELTLSAPVRTNNRIIATLCAGIVVIFHLGGRDD